MLGAPTLEAAERNPLAPAILAGGQTLTYGALEARIRAAAGRLRAHGVAAGDVVALWAPNSAAWAIGLHAIVRLGATALPLSTRWTDGELVPALARTQARWVLVPAEAVDRAGAWGPTALSLEALTGVGPDPGGLPAGQPSERPFALMLTSGTTGEPKAVELGWGQVLASASAVNAVVALQSADRWACTLPLFHVGGLGILVRCALAGAAVVLEPRFDPARLLELCAEPGIAVASFVPTMLRGLLAELGERPWPATLRVAMLGGAAVPPDLVERCPAALATYGLTEACSTVTLVPPGADAQTRASSGKPLPGYAVRVLGGAGAAGAIALPSGAIGRVQVRGPSVMARYRGDDAATARSIGPDGWLDTGDFGWLDEAGCLHLASRREDLIVSGGENVYPAEVEATLARHPAVIDVAVVGCPDDRWGQVPFAFVVLASGPAPTLEAWGDFLADRLARFKHPSGYDILTRLPTLANGKIDRHALKTRANGPRRPHPAHPCAQNSSPPDSSSQDSCP